MPRGKIHIDLESVSVVVLLDMRSQAEDISFNDGSISGVIAARRAHFGSEMRMRVLGRVFVILGVALALYTLEQVVRIKDSKIISWYANGGDGPPGWRLLWRSNQFWFGLLSVVTGIELSRLRIWGRLAAVAICLVIVRSGLLASPRSYFLLLLGCPLLVLLAIPLNFTVCRGDYREVIRQTPHVRYRLRAWLGAVAICVLWALSVLAWPPMIRN